jgi:hypothetical protein
LSPISELLVIGRARGIISITERMFQLEPEHHSGEWQTHEQEQRQSLQHTVEHIALQQIKPIS